jgi:zinc transport system substrate-binding protein
VIDEGSCSMRYIITFLVAATPALAEVPRVVTDIPPVHSLVSLVMGNLGQPDLLLARGADEHDFQLRPSQAGAVADADLLVWIGPELTPWLESALDTRPEGAAALALLDAEGTRLRGYEAGQGSEDPHAWLDPGNAQVWLGLIAADLARLDPVNAATYRANAATAAKGIVALDGEVAAILAPVQGRPIVSFHEAFGYFGEHFGLDFVGSIALGDAAAPGAARLADLRGRIEAGGVVCLFPEAQHDPVLITQMAEGTGARIGAALDPVGSLLEPGPGAYAALLTGLATTIADCAEG